jgi:hypothetical protein
VVHIASNANKIFSLDSVTHQDLFRDTNGQGWVTQFRVTVVAVSKTGKESTPVTIDSATYVNPIQTPVYTVSGDAYGYTITQSNFQNQAELIGTVWIEEIVTNETTTPADNDPRWTFKQNIYTNTITISTYPSIDYRWVRLVLINKLDTTLKKYGVPARVKPNDPVADNNDTTAPATPSVTAGTITYNSIQVSISSSDPDTKGIRLRYKKSSSSLYQTDIIAATAFPVSYTISNLEPSALYNISAAAYDDANNLSSYSTDINVTTSAVTVSPVTNVQLKAGTYSVIGTWTAPVSPPTRIDQYKVELYNSLNSLQQTLYTYSTTVTFVGLSAGTTYYIRVHSIDIYGNQSAATPSGNVTLNASGSASDGVPPSSNPTPVINPLYRALEIKWTAVVNADPVTYDVHISKTNGFTPTYSTTSTNTLALRTNGTFAVIKTMPDPVNTELEAPPTIYYVKIIARDYDGASTAAVPQASSTTSLVNNGDIAANAISANQIQAGSINSDKVLSSELLVDKVFTIGGKRAAISSATVSGGNIVYTTSGAHNFLAQSLVTVTALSPSTFNVSEVQITAVTTNTFTVTNTTGATGSSTGVGTAIAIGKSAIKIDSGSDPYRLYSGAGSYGTTATPFYLDTNGRFSLKDRLFFDGNTTLTIKGVIEAASGNFVGAMTVNNGTMKIGTDAGGTGNDGIYVNANNYWYSSGNIKIGGASNNVTWDGTNLTVTGQINASSGLVTGNFGVTTGTLYVGSTNTTANDRITINSGGIGAYPSGSSTANFLLSLSGSITAKTGTIGGWTITNSPSDLIYKNSIFLDASLSSIYVGNKDTLASGMVTSSTSTDVAFWAGTSFANRASAPFRVLLNGSVVMSNATITGYASSTDLANGLAPKANTTDVNTALSAKANTTDVNTALNSKLNSAATGIVQSNNNITAINTNGITVYAGGSQTTGARVVMNSSGIAGYNSSNQATFSVDASTGSAIFKGDITGASGTFSGSVSVASGTKSTTISSATGIITISDSSSGLLSGGGINITASGGSGTFGATALSFTNGSTTGAFIMNPSDLRVTAGSASTVTITADDGLNRAAYPIYMNGHVSILNSITAFGSATFGSVGSQFEFLSTSGNVRVAQTYNNVVSSGPPRAMYVNSNGLYGYVSSTIRHKENIQDYTVNQDVLMSLDLKSFNYKNDEDKTIHYGFIAEQAESLGLDELIQLNSDGLPEYFDYSRLSVFLFQVVKNQKSKIESLEQRLDALEG